MARALPVVILVLISGREIKIQLSHKDILKIDKKTKYFLYEEFFIRNKEKIKDELNIKAFSILNTMDIIFISFNKYINSENRIKFANEKEFKYNICAIDISFDPFIERLFLDLDYCYNLNYEDVQKLFQNYTYDDQKTLKSILKNNSEFNSNEMFMFTIIKSISSMYIKYVSKKLLHNESFWIRLIKNLNYDYSIIRNIPFIMSSDFIIKLLEINPQIYFNLEVKLRTNKEIVIYCIKNNIISILTCTNFNYTEIFNIDDDVIIKFINNNFNYCITCTDHLHFSIRINKNAYVNIKYDQFYNKIDNILNEELKTKIKMCINDFGLTH